MSAHSRPHLALDDVKLNLLDSQARSASRQSKEHTHQVIDDSVD
jgi:hypothetical protein